MALIVDDTVHCKHCGSVEFLETKKVIINSSFEKNKAVHAAVTSFGIPDRYLHSSTISYVCAECGEELSY